MAKIVKHRRGTTAELSSVLGETGEIFIDTSKKTVVVMDPFTAGGHPLATEALARTTGSTVSLGVVRPDGTSILVTSGVISVNPYSTTSHLRYLGALPATSGTTLEFMQYQISGGSLAGTSNTSVLRIYAQQNSTSSDWTQASIKLQQQTLGIDQGYIEFNPINATTGPAGLGIGVGSNLALRIDSFGRIISNTQPAFICYAAGVSVNYTAGQKVLYDAVPVLNRGSYYSIASSRFTAPVAGLYLFKAHAWTESGNTGSIRFAVNGNQLYGRTGPETVNTLGLVGMNLIEQIYLSANDFVEVFCSIGTIRVDKDYSTFSGYLVG